MGEGRTERAPGQYYSMPPHKHYTRNWKNKKKIYVEIDIFNREIGLIKTNGFVFMLKWQAKKDFPSPASWLFGSISCIVQKANHSL